MSGLGSYLFPNVHLCLMLKYLQLDCWRRRLIFRRFALESPASFRRYNNGLRRSISLATLTAWQSPLITGNSRERPDNVPGPAPSVGTGGPCPPRTGPYGAAKETRGKKECYNKLLSSPERREEINEPWKHAQRKHSIINCYMSWQVSEKSAGIKSAINTLLRLGSCIYSFCSVTERRRMQPGDKEAPFMDKVVVHHSTPVQYKNMCIMWQYWCRGEKNLNYLSSKRH